MTSFAGGCLCGSIRYEGSEPQGGGYCHCDDCRRSSGTGHCSHMMTVYTSRAPAWDPPPDTLPAFEEMPPPSDMPAMAV
jgi:hypothetical protein